MIIKALLILGLLSAAILLIRGRPSAAQLAIRRVGAGILLALGVLSVLFPLWVTAVANAVGVTRGTDLVLYGLVTAFLLTSIALYRKVHELEERYVDLARLLAITEAAVVEPRRRATSTGDAT